MVVRYYSMIYCKVKNQVTRKHFYNYYVFSLHLIKGKATLMLIWGSTLKSSKLRISEGNLILPIHLEMFLWRISCSCFYWLEHILVLS